MGVVGSKVQVEEGEEREGKMVPVGCRPGQILIRGRESWERGGEKKGGEGRGGLLRLQESSVFFNVLEGGREESQIPLKI